MNVLWAGGEDIDFPVIGTVTVNSTAGRFRSGWARYALNQTAGSPAFAKSAPFNGGAVTSAWLSYIANIGTGTNALGAGVMWVGLGLSGTSKGLGVGIDASIAGKLAVFKYDGTTKTMLASESGASIATANNNAAFNRIDLQVVNYGVTATVNVYLAGVSLITFSGDVTVSGVTNLDSVIIFGVNVSNGPSMCFSEIFVADSDTRAVQGLQTLALVGAGTTNAWSNNTFSNINGISFSDASPAFVNATAQDQQYTVTAPTPVVCSVAGVAISARMARTAASTPTNVKLGYGNGASGSFGTGASKALSVGYQTYEQIDMINPVTGVAFTRADIAALQLDIQSA